MLWVPPHLKIRYMLADTCHIPAGICRQKFRYHDLFVVSRVLSILFCDEDELLKVQSLCLKHLLIVSGLSLDDNI